MKKNTVLKMIVAITLLLVFSVFVFRSESTLLINAYAIGFSINVVYLAIYLGLYNNYRD